MAMRLLTLRVRVALLVLTGVLPLLVFQLGSIYQDYRQNRTQADQRTLALARGIALAIEGQLRMRVAVLQILARSDALARGDLDAFRAEAETVRTDQEPATHLLLFREDGQQLMNTAVPPGAPLQVRLALDDLRHVFATNLPSVSDVYTGRILRRPIVAIEVPVRRPDGTVREVLALTPALDAFQGIIRRQLAGENWRVKLIDRAGRLIARAPVDDRPLGELAAPGFLQAWSAASEGTVEVIGREHGVSTVSGFTRVPEFGWTVAVGIPIAELSGPAWHAAMVTSGVGLGLLVLALILAQIVSRSIIGPIFALTRFASRAEGIGVPMPVATGLWETDAVAVAPRSSEANYRGLFESTRDAILLVEPSSGQIISANSSALKIFAVNNEQDLISHAPADWSPERQPDGQSSAHKARGLRDTALREGTCFFEWLHRRADGTEFPADVLLTRVVRGNQTQVYVMIRDISERKLADQRTERMARYDNLTGLVNRVVFVDLLHQAISRVSRDAHGFAVLYLDLDHFKDVNDTLGHPVGDSLLRVVAARLRASVREADTVARFGGNEFAVLAGEVRDPADLTVLADRILRAIGEPFVIDGNEIHSGASVGIAVCGPDSADAETLLSHADVALYRAKADGRSSYRFFTDAMDTEVRARITIGRELREAIAREQFFLMYQPQVEIDTGRVVGLEALVRWRHPTKGIVGPGRFIPATERNGLIVPLGRWLMRDACRQARQWLDAGIAPASIAINLSGMQFKMPLELERDIMATVAEAGLPPRRLELELTEGVLMDASRDHNDVLLRLRENGYRIAIDDFGSGYSSLDYLRRYPVDRIKIAQSFIADIGVKVGSDAIVRAALGLAHELSIEVVVEGVETARQLELLTSWGGRIVQGYYFARPLPVPEVTALLRAGKIAPAQTDPVERAARLPASATLLPIA
jgi:diguanylate cyclase (GGDEF)-like protein/PAS domain S-box-containing protein